MFYIVGTPIGNLEDLSIRQARILSSSEYILAEDTRSTGMLLKKIKELFPTLKAITTPKFISYYKDIEFEKLPQILDLVAADAQISLISQAGMPLISDPGYLLITHIIKRNAPFTVVPGPTAATTALVYSGFSPSHHMFLGFLPRKSGDIRQQVEVLKKIHEADPDTAFIFYDSPNRIKATLGILTELIPQADIVIGRELTKKFEEIVRGKPAELVDRDYRGEITLVIRLS